MALRVFYMRSNLLLEMRKVIFHLISILSTLSMHLGPEHQKSVVLHLLKGNRLSAD